MLVLKRLLEMVSNLDREILLRVCVATGIDIDKFVAALDLLRLWTRRSKSKGV